MQAATVAQIKRELKHLPPEELSALILRLAKFKKDNKELLTYLLFEAGDEHAFVQSIQQEMDEEFAHINTRSFYYMKKSVRKILSRVRKHIRYSGQKSTEVELLMYFCEKLARMEPSYTRSTVLSNLYDRVIAKIIGSIGGLEEDLQYDYRLELEERLGITLNG